MTQCRQCQATNPAGMKFCGQCGAPLVVAVGAAGGAGGGDVAELRQLTVVFCDLVGSTSLSESLDPEDLREVTAAYHDVCAAVIRRHEGHIAQYLGDGVLAYFGYPVAHEDDARRAVRAALEILDGLTRTGRVARGVTLQARVGVHTGPVVVGEVGGGGGARRENLALGKTPNLAARVQGLAAPGTVAVSDDTFRLVRGYFDFAPLGTHDVKGLAEGVTLHRPLRESGVDSRMEAARRSGFSAFTGREEELRLLRDRWHGVRTGGLHTVLLQGEPGIGKSRIVDALREHVARDGGEALESICTPYAQGSDLYPVAGMIERTLGFTRETSNDEKRAAIDAGLAARGMRTAESSALLAQLLQVPVDAAQDPTVAYQPQKRRERTLDVARAWVLASSRVQPALWVVEDTHWADPTTLEFVRGVMAMADAPLLIILTFRPEFQAPWSGERVTTLALARLAAHETTALVERVAGGKSLPPEVMRQLVARTDGVPLFVEEVTKAVLELGVLAEREDRYELTGPLPGDLIPSTVQGSLNARLDRLGPAKATAQLAATIGREFRFDLLRALAPGSDDDLRHGLDRLVGAELIRRVDEVPDETYLFKHALVQDAAYQSLLRKSRRELHARIAETLLSRFPEMVQHRPELVAQHYTEAGQAEPAIRYWLGAGQLAVSRAANPEAVALIQRGLALVPDMPEDARGAQELELLMAIVPALIASQGWASPELHRVYERAEDLTSRVGHMGHRLTLLAGLMGYHFVSGRIRQALGLSHELLDLSLQVGDPLPITIARQDCSASYQYLGDFEQSITHADEGLAILDVERERRIAAMIGLSSCVGLYGYRGHSYWMLGHAEQAIASNAGGLDLARALAHSPSIAFALVARTDLYGLMRDAERTLAFAHEALRYCEEERSWWGPMIQVYRGWAMLALGDAAGGLAEMQAGFGVYTAIGQGIKQVQMRSLIAQGLWAVGKRQEALQTLADGMLLATAHGEGFMEPELYRLRGEFLAEGARTANAPPGVNVGLSDHAAAIAAVQQAIDIARQQKARAMELRARVSMVKVLQLAGREVSGARTALATLLDTFTEGLDLPDAREARACLASLG